MTAALLVLVLAWTLLVLLDGHGSPHAWRHEWRSTLLVLLLGSGLIVLVALGAWSVGPLCRAAPARRAWLAPIAAILIALLAALMIATVVWLAPLTLMPR